MACVFDRKLNSCTFHARTPEGIDGGHLTPRSVTSWRLEPEQERAARATLSVLDLEQPRTFVRRSELSRHLEIPTVDRLLGALSGA